MAVTTTESFLELLEKSRLLEGDRLARARGAAGQTRDAKELAKALVRQELLTRWQAGQLLAGRSSFRLGKYKLIDWLGGGGLGRVFFAEHTTMSRPVALKIISKQLGRDPASLEQFFREARAIAALDHPNIVHAYNVDNEGDRYYLVMEYVEGRDLQRMVETEGPLEFARAADYIRQAADGLAHAHSRGMIHGSIKPTSLLVNRQGVVKILDIGMASLVGSTKDARSEKDEQPAGTADDAAPEQVAETAEADHRGDIYSLGCAFYFLLTGRPPFPQGTPQERVKQQTGEPLEISKLRADVPEKLAGICEKMMAEEPDERFQSAGEVGLALSEWCAAESAAGAAAGDDSAGAAGLGGALTKLRLRTAGALGAMTARQRKLAVAGLGGVAALAVLTIGLIAFLSGSGSEQLAETQTAPDAAASDEKAKAEQKPYRSDEREEAENEWPELPDYGNLRDFDPEAIPVEGAGKSGPADQKPEPKRPNADKPPSEKPSPAKPEPKETGSAKAEPDRPDAESPPKSASSEGSSRGDAGSEKVEPDGPGPKEAEDGQQEAEKAEPPEAEPEKEEPGEAPPPKPKPEDIFGDLAESVDLPELGGTTAPADEADAAVTFGKIQTGPDVDWQLDLLGGETAMRRGRNFVLKPEETNRANASWRVSLEVAVSGKEPISEPTARIWREGNELKFQWADDAETSANYLRNCILQVRASGKSKHITLTRPRTLEPIGVDLERGVVTASAPVKWLPDAGNLRVEITKVEGREGHSVEPAQPASPKDPFKILFPRKDRHGNVHEGVKLEIDFTPRATALAVRLRLEEPPARSFKSLRGNAVIARNRLEARRDGIQKQLNPKDKDKAPRGEQRSRLIAQLDEIEMNMWYIDFYIEVQGNAKVHYRVLTEADGRQVVLAST